MRLTPKLNSQVCDAFVSRFGKYAGWAQNVLFIGELPSQKALVAAADDAKSAKRKRVGEKVTVQVVVQSGGVNNKVGDSLFIYTLLLWYNSCSSVSHLSKIFGNCSARMIKFGKLVPLRMRMFQRHSCKNSLALESPRGQASKLLPICCTESNIEL